MSVKKIGIAEYEIEENLWFVEGRKGKYRMRERLIEGHPDVKAAKNQWAKYARKYPPKKNKVKERDAYFKGRKASEEQLAVCLEQAFEDLKQESFTYPIPLKKDRDHAHHRQWRYCLYQGNIYQFDKHGYSDEAMLEQIKELEERKTANKE